MYQNIQIAQQRQNISYEKRKGQNVKSFLINVGDEVLRANKRKEGNWFGLMWFPQSPTRAWQPAQQELS
ncbi:hypothetical protein CgunFtcFv8_018188 [Champsocephalus gunnari]|uniref:Uncharacterized protein n=1 Tax=Champsocephalus gunnari TaxID=52237 RepID=A0AAN8HR72_CHAGU|nr:hypothetical protein CgunFtcFv8_018188 [Champsocephalus gunnari]